MQLKIKSQRDFWAGIMFVVAGILGITISSKYPMGTIRHMGPGYYPRLIGILITILGAIISLTAFKIEGEKIDPFGWRGLVMLTLAFSFFGWAVDRIGFIPAMFVLVICSAYAGKKAKLLHVLIMGAILIIGSVFLFIYGLKLPFSLFWR